MIQLPFTFLGFRVYTPFLCFLSRENPLAFVEELVCSCVAGEFVWYMSCSGTCWPLGGTWFQCRYGGFWMISYQLMFLGVKSSLVFSDFGLKPSASGFQSYSYNSLKTSPCILIKCLG